MKTLSLLSFLLIFNFAAFAGHYLEYKITGGHLSGGTIKTWYQNKNTRSEMEITHAKLPVGKNFAYLFLGDKPNTMYMIDEESKSYSVTEYKSPADKPKGESTDFEFTVVGQEKVNGYNATHVRAKNKKSAAVMDWWLSKEVQGYEDIKDLKTKEIDASMWLNGLKGKGVEGFPVRMVMNSENAKARMQMDLVKAQVMDIQPSKFSLEGYTKKEGNPMLPGGLDPEKIKNMTPEERQKFMEEMMKQYQK